VLIFEHSVDWSGGCETPAGEGVTGDPTGVKRRGGSRTPPRKGSAWNGNQQINLTKPLKLAAQF